ncbi:hypothetical protein ABDD95_21820 [Mucilaginibacter sp. PAMB04274]|uniref:hypothetical protein n=1 Tax=Mucilaginibacter sp. PAMB04274 TaxID=3138568 RepID=UPI0031F72194
MVIQLLMLLLLLQNAKTSCYLAADLKRGKQILSEMHGVRLNKGDGKYTLALFDPYARLALNSMTYSNKKVGTNTVTSWKRMGKHCLEIYQIESVIHVNTTILLRISPDAAKLDQESYPVNADFHYRTYIIKDSNKPIMVYTLAAEGELLEYKVRNHLVRPVYEDVILGQPMPAISDLLKMINRH